MKVRFTVTAGERSYSVTRPMRKGVAVEEERHARAFARAQRSNSYRVKTELLTRD